MKHNRETKESDEQLTQSKGASAQRLRVKKPAEQKDQIVIEVGCDTRYSSHRKFALLLSNGHIIPPTSMKVRSYTPNTGLRTEASIITLMFPSIEEDHAGFHLIEQLDLFRETNLPYFERNEANRYSVVQN